MNKINRRQWIKSGALLSGGAALATMPFANLFAKTNPTGAAAEIEEIHIINLSHHDYGYTDLPSSVWDYQVNNIRLAMRFIDETKSYPLESQFKWTCEGLWGLEHFWQQASQKEKDEFDKHVANGAIEVTFMPGNMTCLVGRYEWEKELDRLGYFIKKYKPVVALQDDVNGQPWGMVDSLLARNVKYFTMAANGYRGGNPLPTPSFFWWEGSQNKKILMFNGEGYANGFDYFNAKEWRRGPVPNRYDIWFNSPSGNEIFSAKKEDLLKSQQILQDKLEKLRKQGYLISTLAVTFTNEWTIDNDLPCRQLSEFIRAWNEQGMKPKLVFSTPSRFLEKASSQLPADLPTLKGEWVDWWADGIAASPYEVALLQAAKRRNQDIGNILQYFSVASDGISKQIEELNHQLVFASEHTWGSYDSVAHPYNARTGGNHAEKFDYFFRADEASKRIQVALIRESNNYKPLSQTAFLEVINPGQTPRSGWAEISAAAVRTKVNGVKDLQTGGFLPFEETLSSEWRPAEGASETPPEIPNDVWPFFPGKYRFHLDNLQGGERRKFELVYEQNPTVKPVLSSRYFKPVTDDKTGGITNVLYLPINKFLFDEQKDELPGQLIVERPQGKYVRNKIDERKLATKDILYNKPAIKKAAKPNSHYALRYQYVLEEPFAKQIEQQWDFFDVIPRIEITTTIWLKENLDPLAVYLAFPFAIQSSRAFYDSLGCSVEVGKDQMQNTCGLYNTVQNGVGYRGNDISLALSTPDSPMGAFENIVTGQKRTVFTPKTAHFYSMLCENYWMTNFAVLQPARLEFHHIIECGKPGDEILPLEGTELWGYPTANH